jgi:hypothetical protein
MFNVYIDGVKFIGSSKLVTYDTLSGDGTTADPLSVNIDGIYMKEEYSTYRSSKDGNEIFTVITYKRSDGTTYMVSTLSGGTSPEYTTRTVQYYDTDGTTLLKTETYTLSYDVDGNLESEVLD